MSTVAEAPKPVAAPAPVAEEAPALPEWKMPTIRAGMEVFWYKLGTPVAKYPPEIAIVQKVWKSQVELRALSGMALTSVRHLTDPLFDRNPELRRENGAWDFTDEHVGRIADMAEMKSRISTLEATVAELKAALDKKKA